MSLLELYERFRKARKSPKPTEIYHVTFNCGQPYTIEKIIRPDSSYLCKTHGDKATIQYAVIDGRGEPQGSFYNCSKCPDDINSLRAQYLATIGYTEHSEH